MVITKLEYQKKDPNRVNIFIDNKFWAGVRLDLVAEYGLYKGLQLDEQLLDEVLHKELIGRLYDRSVNYLVKAPKTEMQLRRYISELIFKKTGDWFDESIELQKDSLVESIIHKVSKLGLINDREYARLFIESRLRSKPRGRTVLFAELLSKGVDRQIANEMLSELLTDEFALIKQTYTKKYRDQPITKKDSKKIAYLQRKGFSWDLISKFISANESGE